MPVPVMTVERRSPSSTESTSWNLGLVGGTVGGGGARSDVSATWRGESLVLARASYAGPDRQSGPFTERVETWSLDAEGLLQVTITERTFGTPPKTEVQVFRKR